MTCCESLRHKLAALAGLTGSERRMLAEAWWTLLFVDGLVRAWSLPRVQGWVGTRFRTGPAGGVGLDWQAIRRLEQLVGLAGRHQLYPITCLRQALALQVLLARRGTAAELRLGVRKDAQRLLAHAWLEFDGQILDPSGEQVGFLQLQPVLKASSAGLDRQG